MGVAERLRELRTAGKHELVVTLATEVLRKESPQVSVVDGRVRVETRTFVGEHALDGVFDPSDRGDVDAAVERRGTYRLRDPDEVMAGFTFDSGCHHDAIVEDLHRTPASGAADSEETETAATLAAPTPGPAGDADATTRTAPSRSGRAAEQRSGESTSVFQRAVVAVQNQFRE
ncbi:hypothetical protein [Halomarina litorea]|uniref:hypothetical protein n=1 Tax=Halomarina litorea TaxID=2961595 RepID=UPI0020C3956D|nr:hypothetical protein [Halomarina sp. BCD28]